MSGFARSWWSSTRRQPLTGVSGGTIVILTMLALFAPLLANERDLFVQTARGWSSPAMSGTSPDEMEEVISRLSSPIPYGPDEIDLASRLQPPGREHWLGTDELGRDLAARIIHGARVSMTVGIAATAIALLIGTFLGAAAGFYGGVIDRSISRLIEVVLCFPFLFLVLAISSLYEPSLRTVVIALGLTAWTTEARLIRGEFLRLREMEFAEAARAGGAGDLRVIVRHLLPHALAPVIVSASFGVSSAILTESALSFLGFGIPLPTASWGGILSAADDHLMTAWWLALFPGLCIFLAAAAFNLLGEGFRRAIDPVGSEPGNQRA